MPKAGPRLGNGDLISISAIPQFDSAVMLGPALSFNISVTGQAVALSRATPWAHHLLKGKLRVKAASQLCGQPIIQCDSANYDEMCAEPTTSCLDDATRLLSAVLLRSSSLNQQCRTVFGEYGVNWLQRREQRYLQNQL